MTMNTTTNTLEPSDTIIFRYGDAGRNHSQMTMVKNPFVGQAGNTDAYVLVTATSGKSMADVGNAAIKLTAFLSVTGIAQTPAATTDPSTADSGSDPGTTLGGTSAWSSSPRSWA